MTDMTPVLSEAIEIEKLVDWVATVATVLDMDVEANCRAEIWDVCKFAVEVTAVTATLTLATVAEVDVEVAATLTMEVEV